MDLYGWIKTLHVVAIISWMAAILYLPRLFVYHCAAAPGSETSETFKVMERRLLNAIAKPAMVVAWIAGLAMIFMAGWWSSGWMHAKLALVVALSGYTGALGRWVRDFAADRNTRGHRFYRIMNEVPTLLMVLIVALVILKPF